MGNINTNNNLIRKAKMLDDNASSKSNYK